MEARAMRLVYMAAPVSGDVPANLARARRWYRWLVELYWPDFRPVADWIVAASMFDDSQPTVRRAELDACMELAKRCDQLWLVGGRISAGMQTEALAVVQQMPVYDLTPLGPEPPAGRVGIAEMRRWWP